MARNNHSIGNASEFYMIDQLAQHGYITGKTDDSQTLIDVIATDPETLKSINIQAKTRNVVGEGWIMSAKNERAFEGLWNVLLQLNGTDALPNFYLFHSSLICPCLHDDHHTWLALPKRNGKPRKDSHIWQFWPSEDQLEKARDRWDLTFSDSTGA